jgi:hypothetical protein
MTIEIAEEDRPRRSRANRPREWVRDGGGGQDAGRERETGQGAIPIVQKRNVAIIISRSLPQLSFARFLLFISLDAVRIVPC